MAAGIVLEFVGPERAAEVRELMFAAFREYDGVLTVPCERDVGNNRRHRGAHRGGWRGARDMRGPARGVRPQFVEIRDNHVYIGRLSVLPEFRGRGIGALMMTALDARRCARRARSAHRRHAPAEECAHYTNASVTS